MESSWTLFIKQVTNKKFSKGEIARMFKKVSKNDYDSNDKERLIDYAFSLTKHGSSKPR